MRRQGYKTDRSFPRSVSVGEVMKMKSRIYCFFIFLVIILDGAASDRLVFQTDTGFINTDITSGLLQKAEPLDFPECSRYCLRNHRCLSFTFRQDNGTCKLHNEVYSTAEAGGGRAYHGATYYYAIHLDRVEEDSKEMTTEPYVLTTKSDVSNTKPGRGKEKDNREVTAEVTSTTITTTSSTPITASHAHTSSWTSSHAHTSPWVYTTDGNQTVAGP